MVADCRAQSPMVWIPHAVGAPFMTPVRVHGGGLSGVRSGGVYAVRVFGRHKWRPYVFCGGMGIPVALAVVPVALTVSPGGVPVRGCGVATVSVWQSGKIVALKIISIGNFVD